MYLVYWGCKHKGFGNFSKAEGCLPEEEEEEDNNNNNNNTFNCKWALARWQWLLCMYINMK